MWGQGTGERGFLPLLLANYGVRFIINDGNIIITIITSILNYNNIIISSSSWWMVVSMAGGYGLGLGELGGRSFTPLLIAYQTKKL